jgi:CheY-like chemotaxis protein
MFHIEQRSVQSADFQQAPAMTGYSTEFLIRAAKRWRVLVIDDQPDSAQSLAFLVEDMGHDTRFAFTGDDALAIAPLFKPQVVFLDLELPDIEGHDLARKLRALPGCSTARIFAVTGHGSDDDRHRSRESGLDGHFIKPLDPSFVENLLTKHI